MSDPRVQTVFYYALLPRLLPDTQAAYFGGTEDSAEGHLRRLADNDGLAVIQFTLVVVVMFLVTWGLTSGTLHWLATRPRRALQVNAVTGTSVGTC